MHMDHLSVNLKDYSQTVHRGERSPTWTQLQDWVLYSLTVAEEELGCGLLNRREIILNVIIFMLQRNPP